VSVGEGGIDVGGEEEVGVEGKLTSMVGRLTGLEGVPAAELPSTMQERMDKPRTEAKIRSARWKVESNRIQEKPLILL
jgi:hypothetical protein